jgi:hypothetical protein
MILEEFIEKQVLLLNNSELKRMIGRERLRFSRRETLRLLLAFLKQHETQMTFLFVYKSIGFRGTYQNFSKNLKTLAPLWEHLFFKFNQQNSIHFDSLTLMDTSLLPQKNEQSITQKDWKNKTVTTRSKNKTKIRICGRKLFAVLNSKDLLVGVNLLSINESDQNLLKTPYSYIQKGMKNTVLLADRGFNNKSVRARFDYFNKEIGSNITFISPPHVKEKRELTAYERNLYKKRWNIEEVFRQMKHPLLSSKLSLYHFRHSGLQKAKVYLSSLIWNAEKIK